VAADAGTDLEAEHAKAAGDDAGRALLLARDLGVAMEIAPKGDQVQFDRAKMVFESVDR
jgi:hypothetical protein